MVPPQLLTLPDGRVLAFDDVGAPDGEPVLYLHGTPDSRLARHPDDGLATAAGVRLIAIDRPGAGDSARHPGGGYRDLAADVTALLDHLGLAAVRLLGWSSGGLAALVAASVLRSRVAAVLTVGGLPPVEAYADPAVMVSLGPNRRPFVEMAAEVPRAELATEIAPYMVPLPLTEELALEHVLEGAGSEGRADLGAVAGAPEALAQALVLAMAQGPDWLVDDVAAQLEPGLPIAPDAPVVTVHGTADGISPPAVGEWLSGRLPTITTEVVEGGSHHLLFPRWADLLDRLVRTA